MNIIGEAKVVNWLKQGEEWFNIIAVEDRMFVTDQEIQFRMPWFGTREADNQLRIPYQYVSEYHPR